MTDVLDRAPAIVRNAEEAWLDERDKGLGASDSAKILTGRGLEVYGEKVGKRKPSTPYMRWGRRLEGLVAEMYGEESGRKVGNLGQYEIQRHPDHPWLGATLDRVTTMGTEPSLEPKFPLECKVQGWHRSREWEEEVPLEYQIQVQIQMACTGAEAGAIAALIGWPPKPQWIDLVRNDSFLKVAIPRLEEFWLRVQRREAPVPNDHRDLEVVKRIWSRENGQTISLADPIVVQSVELWKKLREERSEKEKEAEALEAKLRALVGDASIAMLADGTWLELADVDRKGYTVEPTTYRTLRHKRPKLPQRRAS